ncbi:hypothetical protein DYB28_000371 [Aphanomyces astaci]|uniref:N-acetyltransferase domain-containing protein n=1 Tax=Aphanomyces astaci TaxID=112090 RepID=A0A397E668_APHAT|nr:hypothetical protein DYB38_005300 [Aphanomyces astaci]RLO10197.1 hypothetical protein DYB28_000371 [Aphanomyces astaci]
MLDQLPSWIAMYFVVAFSSSLDVAAIEMALHKPLDHNAELQTIGWSNVISGLTGGFTGSYIFSSTIFSMKSGVDSRLTGVLVFALELVLVVSLFSIISYVPKLFTLLMGKAEGKGENWHGHVTAVTVAPEFRRLGLAKNLMDYLENSSWGFMLRYDGYFVDLFVRVSNTLAIGMYEKFGYSVYRRVIGYYSGDDDGEDAFGNALPRDKDKKSIIPLPYPVMPDSLMD